MDLPEPDVRKIILDKIRRLAEANARQAPGQQFFERETGIRVSEWRGKFWARWGDAVIEAGLRPNEMQQRLDEDFFMQKMVEAFRHYGKVPTDPEFRIYARRDKEFPAPSTIHERYGSNSDLLGHLSAWIRERREYEDIASILKGHEHPSPTKEAIGSEGFVYLMKSGMYYKIGRSDQIERRVKEIKVSMPDAVSLVHAIRTDDPVGIEAYWHRRFSEPD